MRKGKEGVISRYRTFVIAEEHCDHLRRLYQEHRGVEEIGHEGGSPVGVHLTHKVVYSQGI